MSSKVFRRVGGLNPGRSAFDLSYEKKFTCDMGQLIPVMCEEAVPGDIWKIGNELVIRFQPLAAPTLHEINAYVHNYFVPYRLLWDDWEDFISGGVDGEFAAELPRWTPGVGKNGIGSLWDYLGFPVGVNPAGALPLDFPRRAYNFVYNEYYRDQNLQDEIPLDNQDVLNRAWEKDYFTSALPWQQRGPAPALPIAGTARAIFEGLIDSRTSGSTGATTEKSVWLNLPPDGVRLVNIFSGAYGGVSPTNDQLRSWFNNNHIDLGVASTFDIADLRLAFQVQKWMERNARAGVRYTEFLRSHFGVAPRDERLDRPEYIGGSKSPIILSEVLQTSSTNSTSPQGHLAGHGITADKTFISTYRVQEFGLIIGIMSVMPSVLSKTNIKMILPSLFSQESPQALLST